MLELLYLKLATQQTPLRKNFAKVGEEFQQDGGKKVKEKKKKWSEAMYLES